MIVNFLNMIQFMHRTKHVYQCVRFHVKNGIISLKDKEELNAVECDNERITQGQKSDLNLDFNSINQSFEKNSDT